MRGDIPQRSIISGLKTTSPGLRVESLVEMIKGVDVNTVTIILVLWGIYKVVPYFYYLPRLFETKLVSRWRLFEQDEPHHDLYLRIFSQYIVC